jgi:hypothetical protein
MLNSYCVNATSNQGNPPVTVNTGDTQLVQSRVGSGPDWPIGYQELLIIVHGPLCFAKFGGKVILMTEFFVIGVLTPPKLITIETE